MFGVTSNKDSLIDNDCCRSVFVNTHGWPCIHRPCHLPSTGASSEAACWWQNGTSDINGLIHVSNTTILFSPSRLKEFYTSFSTFVPLFKMKFTGKIVIAAFALVAVPSASAAKWDCWKGFQCAGALPQAPSSGYPYEALLVANGCKCATDNCVGEYDQMPCFQAISPEACFEKGGNSASLWGDMKSDGPKGPQNSDMTKENDPCFMNKYDCWTDCHCKVIPTDEMFFNAMGGGPDACFALDQSITSTCIWGHCNEDYATDVCPEGHAGWDGSKPTCNTDTVPMTVPKDPCKSNSDCGKTWGGTLAKETKCRAHI